MKKILNTLTISNFISKYTNYIYIDIIHIFITYQLFLRITCLQLFSLLGDLQCNQSLYRMICLQMNSLQHDLFVAELSTV